MEENPDLPDNYNLAYGILNSVLKRLREKPEMLKMNDDVIKDQLDKVVTESVDDNSMQEKLNHYNPYHVVVTPFKNTTKP